MAGDVFWNIPLRRGLRLGDFIGDWLAFGLSITVFGSDLLGKMLI